MGSTRPCPRHHGARRHARAVRARWITLRDRGLRHAQRMRHRLHRRRRGHDLRQRHGVGHRRTVVSRATRAASGRGRRLRLAIGQCEAASDRDRHASGGRRHRPREPRRRDLRASEFVPATVARQALHRRLVVWTHPRGRPGSRRHDLARTMGTVRHGPTHARDRHRVRARWCDVRGDRWARHAERPVPDRRQATLGRTAGISADAATGA